jgi:hypothetical protein
MVRKNKHISLSTSFITLFCVSSIIGSTCTNSTANNNEIKTSKMSVDKTNINQIFLPEYNYDMGEYYASPTNIDTLSFLNQYVTGSQYADVINDLQVGS